MSGDTFNAPTHSLKWKVLGRVQAPAEQRGGIQTHTHTRVRRAIKMYYFSSAEKCCLEQFQSFVEPNKN